MHHHHYFTIKTRDHSLAEGIVQNELDNLDLESYGCDYFSVVGSINVDTKLSTITDPHLSYSAIDKEFKEMFVDSPDKQATLADYKKRACEAINYNEFFVARTYLNSAWDIQDGLEFGKGFPNGFSLDELLNSGKEYRSGEFAEVGITHIDNLDDKKPRHPTHLFLVVVDLHS